jgi:FtsH-binding integral membrane protein
MIVQIGVVVTLSAAVARLSAGLAMGLFLGYAALTGVTLSTLFLIYTRDSIAGVFLSTAFGFAGLSLMGYTTKRDLGPLGAFCGMALFGLIGWGLLSFFFPSLLGGQAGTAYSAVGVLIFAGLTAYDTQRIKAMATSDVYGVGLGMESKAAIVGALALYLDFINLFLSLLRLFGDRRR